MHDKLTQRCRALVAVPAVNHEQTTDVLKLSDGEVCSQRRLLPLLFTHNNEDAIAELNLSTSVTSSSTKPDTIHKTENKGRYSM